MPTLVLGGGGAVAAVMTNQLLLFLAAEYMILSGGGDFQQPGLGLRPEIHDQADVKAACQQGAPQCLFRLPFLKGDGRSGQLTEAEKETWQHILGLGQVHYLYERNGKRLGSGDYESRSECVVKLYVQWLKEDRLPECVLKFFYQKFLSGSWTAAAPEGCMGL